MMAAILIFSTLLMIQISIQNSVIRRVINDEDAERDQFPFIASIQYTYLPFFPYIHACCGVVIDKLWILTTAVCVNRISGVGKARVKMNMNFTYKKDESARIIKIARKFAHQNYTGGLRINDIGLIKLKTAISNPVPAKLLQPSVTPTGNAYMASWSWAFASNFRKISEVLQYGLVNILNNQQCDSLLSHLPMFSHLKDSQMCTYTPAEGIIGCGGDSGGPVFRYTNEEPEIIGLISWDLNPCGKEGVPNIHTRVSEFTEWINETMEEIEKVPSSVNNLTATLLVTTF